jgi:hypothetical protein
MRGRWLPGRAIAVVGCLLIVRVVSSGAQLSDPPIRTKGGNALQQPVSLRKLSRCWGVRGPACALYYAQQQQLLPQQPRVVYASSTACAAIDSCGSRGVCHADTGLCDCPAGACWQRWRALVTDDACVSPARPRHHATVHAIAAITHPGRCCDTRTRTRTHARRRRGPAVHGARPAAVHARLQARRQQQQRASQPHQRQQARHQLV